MPRSAGKDERLTLECINTIYSVIVPVRVRVVVPVALAVIWIVIWIECC